MYFALLMGSLSRSFCSITANLPFSYSNPFTVSVNGTSLPHLTHHLFWFSGCLHFLCSNLNAISSFCVAADSFIGTFIKPKFIAPFHIVFTSLYLCATFFFLKEKSYQKRKFYTFVYLYITHLFYSTINVLLFLPLIDNLYVFFQSIVFKNLFYIYTLLLLMCTA